jgi:hypothetical protein
MVRAENCAIRRRPQAVRAVHRAFVLVACGADGLPWRPDGLDALAVGR